MIRCQSSKRVAISARSSHSSRVVGTAVKLSSKNRRAPESSFFWTRMRANSSATLESATFNSRALNRAASAPLQSFIRKRVCPSCAQDSPSSESNVVIEVKAVLSLRSSPVRRNRPAPKRNSSRSRGLISSAMLSSASATLACAGESVDWLSSDESDFVLSRKIEKCSRSGGVTPEGPMALGTVRTTLPSARKRVTGQARIRDLGNGSCHSISRNESPDF